MCRSFFRHIEKFFVILLVESFFSAEIFLQLRQITLGMFPPSKYQDFRSDIPVLIAVSVFVAATGRKDPKKAVT